MSKQKKQVFVYEGEEFDGSFPSYDWTAPQVLEWLSDLIDEIPEEHRAESRCEFGTETNYDVTKATLEISYWRMETDEEEAAREANAEHARLMRLADERRTYELLRDKFEAK